MYGYLNSFLKTKWLTIRTNLSLGLQTLRAPQKHNQRDDYRKSFKRPARQLTFLQKLSAKLPEAKNAGPWTVFDGTDIHLQSQQEDVNLSWHSKFGIESLVAIPTSGWPLQDEQMSTNIMHPLYAANHPPDWLHFQKSTSKTITNYPWKHILESILKAFKTMLAHHSWMPECPSGSVSHLRLIRNPPKNNFLKSSKGIDMNLI